MFSGIVEGMGSVEMFEPSDDGALLRVRAPWILDGAGGLKVSESVCVSGACLTVIELDEWCFGVDVSAETLRKTWFSSIKHRESVNLERSLRYGDRVGGHLVQGHVDGVACVTDVMPDGDARLVRVECGVDMMGYVVEKGFVALDGASLTCFDCDGSGFWFTMIPYTGRHTTLGTLSVGDKVNLETDMTAKYVERSLARFAESMDAIVSEGI